MDFTFSDESESNIVKFTKDCKEFPALSYVASARSDDPARYRLSFLYAFNLDGMDLLISSDGHRMNYAPFKSDTDFSVVKQAKNEIVLERIKNIREQMPAFDKVMPRDKDVFHIKPYDVYGWGFSEWNLEFLVDYLYRLSGFKAAFNFKHLAGFIDSIRGDGKIRILCPRSSPGAAWRIEHTDNRGSLRHGTVFMPLADFNELAGVKSPYIENSGFKEYAEAVSGEGSDG
jgi:hypothetical protein